MAAQEKARSSSEASQLLVFLPDPRERKAIARAAEGHARVRACVNGEDGLAALRSGAIGAIIWDIGGAQCSELATMLRAAGHEGITIPRLLLRAELNRVDHPSLFRVVAATNDLQVSLRRVDDILADASALLSPSYDPTPEWPVLRAIARLELTAACNTVVAAVLVGKRRTTVTAFAALLGVPRRTLEARVKRATLPAIEDLLGWSVALWASWRTSVLRWPLKRGVTASGFHTAEAEANYVERHTAGRPHEIEGHGGFGTLLDEFVALLFPAGSRG